jgi:hypothetical protein
MKESPSFRSNQFGAEGLFCISRPMPDRPTAAASLELTGPKSPWAFASHGPSKTSDGAGASAVQQCRISEVHEKSEIRMSKHETNSKSETPIVDTQHRLELFKSFRASCLFRISTFVFRIYV